MTNRRPQDPQTKRMPDPEADVPTFDPGATVMPDDLDDPDKTTGPRGFEAPKPRAVRGGAAANPANTSQSGADPTMTANDLGALREQVRKKAQTGVSTRPKRKGPGWAVWAVAFLLLGGIGFGVAWLVMNNPSEAGGAAQPDAKPPAESEAKADASTASADATPSDAASASADGAADAVTAGADAGADVMAASADAGADAMAASADAAADGADAQAANADAAADAMAASADAAAEVGSADAQAAGADGASPSEAAADAVNPDAQPSGAAADTTAPSDAVAAVADAVSPGDASAAPDVAAVEKPTPPNPAEATRLNEQGLAARKAGDHAGALALYERAAKADPDAVWPRYNYACELAIAGRAKDALDELTKLYKLGTPEAKRALQAARKDSDFASIKNEGRFFRLTNF